METQTFIEIALISSAFSHPRDPGISEYEFSLLASRQGLDELLVQYELEREIGWKLDETRRRYLPGPSLLPCDFGVPMPMDLRSAGAFELVLAYFEAFNHETRGLEKCKRSAPDHPAKSHAGGSSGPYTDARLGGSSGGGDQFHGSRSSTSSGGRSRSLMITSRMYS